MNPLDRTRIEKAAADCGFDLTARYVNEQLELRSTRFPELVEVRTAAGGTMAVRASDASLLEGARSGEEGWAQVAGFSELYRLLEQAAAVGRTLPNRVAEQFRSVTGALPRTTEAERLVVQRVGQDLFRAALLDYWHGRCCVTGLAVADLLRASHIKPWAACESDEERLDVFNGLLLAPHLDALFDGGWVSFDTAGRLTASPRLPNDAVSLLGLDRAMSLVSMSKRHDRYLEHHRVHVFRR